MILSDRHTHTTFSDGENTPEEMEEIIQAVAEIVAYLRSFSPVWRDLQEGKTPHLL